MSKVNKETGNPQINTTRDSFNDNVQKLSILGKTKKVQWGDMRRYRTIKKLRGGAAGSSPGS